jgi:hypothetical protein
MDSQLRVSAVIFVGLLCVCLLVAAESAAVHSRVSADTLLCAYVIVLCGMCSLWQAVNVSKELAAYVFRVENAGSSCHFSRSLNAINREG